MYKISPDLEIEKIFLETWVKYNILLNKITVVMSTVKYLNYLGSVDNYTWIY